MDQRRACERFSPSVTAPLPAILAEYSAQFCEIPRRSAGVQALRDSLKLSCCPDPAAFWDAEPRGNTRTNADQDYLFEWTSVVHAERFSPSGAAPSPAILAEYSAQFCEIPRRSAGVQALRDSLKLSCCPDPAAFWDAEPRGNTRTNADQDYFGRVDQRRSC